MKLSDLLAEEGLQRALAAFLELPALGRFTAAHGRSAPEPGLLLSRLSSVVTVSARAHSYSEVVSTF